jgi:hypothetical protein
MGRRSYWIAFVLCAVAATVPLLVTDVLPMSDLPEHMAQVSIWKHFDDPCHRFSEIYRLHWTTPYLLGYVLTRLLAEWLPVSTAIVVTVWLSIILLPLSVRALLARGGGDVWWSLLAFPLAYGYSFYWGFLNFSIALPIAIYAIALLYDGRRRNTAIAALALLLLVAHVLLFAFFGVVASCVAIARRSVRLVLAVAPGFVLTAVYVLRLRLRQEPNTEGGLTWNVGAARLLDFPSTLFANSWEPAALPLLAVVILAIATARPSLTRDSARWVLLGLAAAACFLGPAGAFGATYLAGRFAVLAVVGALFVLEAPGRRVSRAIVIIFVFVSMGILTARFRRFDAEAREFDPIVESLPSNRRVALLNVLPFSEHVPGPVYWHFAALYQVRKGGLIAWSFAGHHPPLVRYRDGAEPVVRSRSTPVEGIDWPGLLQYDYILLRAPYVSALAGAPVPLVQHARSGMWWAYATPHARVPRPQCSSLDE